MQQCYPDPQVPGPAPYLTRHLTNIGEDHHNTITNRRAVNYRIIWINRYLTGKALLFGRGECSLRWRHNMCLLRNVMKRLQKHGKSKFLRVLATHVEESTLFPKDIVSIVTLFRGRCNNSHLSFKMIVRHQDEEGNT